uniref:Uncharacterized protein n=2 Tax=Ditylum brightwellii TaxID=49249 RepID=A0A7S4T2E0_9STRA
MITVKHKVKHGSEDMDECVKTIENFLSDSEHLSREIPYIVGVQLLSVGVVHDHGDNSIDSSNIAVLTSSVKETQQQESHDLKSKVSFFTVTGLALGGLALTGVIVYMGPRF